MDSSSDFRERSRFLLSLAIVVALAVGSARQAFPAASSGESNRDEQEIQVLVASYAKSIDQADRKLASQIWLNSPDVSFIHPLGHEHGFDQIQQNVYQHLMGDTFSERKLSPRNIRVHVHGDSAWVEFYWDFVAKLRKDGSVITTHGRETQVYWKMPSGWRLVHVHYSGMPVANEKQGF